MAVTSLQDVCRRRLSQMVVQEDTLCVTGDLLWMNLMRQLDHGAWGEESMTILNRAIEYYGHKVTPRIIEALLPSSAKSVCLKECPKITEQCVDVVVERCQHLQLLDMTGNPNLAFESIQLFQADSRVVHSQLTVVILEDCSTVCDEEVQALLKNAPSLHTLNIARCSITDRVFLINEPKQLAREACLQLPPLTDGYDCKLHTVDVSRCKYFSSTGVRHLCTLCGPTLRSVNLYWTHVDCTALLYLSGFGLPAAVQFYLSLDFLGKPMVEALLFMLQTFNDISLKIRDQWHTGQLTLSEMQSNSACATKTSTVKHDIGKTAVNISTSDAATVDCNSDSALSHACLTDCSVRSSDIGVSNEKRNTFGDFVTADSSLQATTCDDNTDPVVTSEFIACEYTSAIPCDSNGCKEGFKVFHDKEATSKIVANVSENSGYVVSEEAILCEFDRSETMRKESLYVLPDNEECSEWKNDIEEHSTDEDKLISTAKVDCDIDFSSEICSEAPNTVTDVTKNGNSRSIESYDGPTEQLHDAADSVKAATCVSHVDTSFTIAEDTSSTALKNCDGNSPVNTISNFGSTSDEAVIKDITAGSTSSSEPQVTSKNNNTDDKLVFTDSFRTLQISADTLTSDVIKKETIGKTPCEQVSGNAEENRADASLQEVHKGETPECGEPSEKFDSLDTTNNSLSPQTETSGSNEQSVKTDSLTRNDNPNSQSSITNDNTTDKKQPFFTSDITSLCIGGKIFEDEPMGIKCLEKFLITNPNLSRLKLCGGMTNNFVSDNAMAVIGAHGRSISSMSIEGCDHVTNLGLGYLVKCKNLTDLDLTGVAFIEDPGIVMLVLGHDFSRLLLAETRITSITLNTIVKRSKYSELKELDLSWCEDMEEADGLDNVVKNCTSLERLMLRECISLTTTTLDLLAGSCHLITELSIASNMNLVRDGSVIMLSENMPLLERIDLGWNTHLTDKSIQAMLANCRRLKWANLEGLKQLTSAPFVNIIAVPETLNRFIEQFASYGCGAEDSTDGQHSEAVTGVGQSELKLSQLPCLPHRSTLYSTELLYLHLKYSDYVEDNILQELVAVTQGSIRVIDYYGEEVEEMPKALERFVNRLITERGCR